MKYFYSAESPIQQIAFIKTETGGKRAYLFAQDGSSPEALQTLREQITDKGFITLPSEHDGQNALEIRKYNKPESLVSALKTIGAVQGNPHIERSAEDRVGPWQWFKNNTYKSSLALYLFGDVGYSLYGSHKEKFDVNALNVKNSQRTARKLPKYPKEPSNPYDKYAGWAYTAGTAVSIASTAMRGDQSDEEVEGISKDIEAHLKEQTPDFKPSNTLKAVEDPANQTTLQKAKTFFGKHPSEFLNSFYAAAGALLGYAAFKGLKGYQRQLGITQKALGKSEEALKAAQKTGGKNKNTIQQLEQEIKTLQHDSTDFKKHIKVKRQDIALGGITLGSGALAVLVREKAIDSDEPEPKGMLQKTKRWFEEKPLRIAGIGYLVSTVIHLMSTISDYSRIGSTTEKGQAILNSSKSSMLREHAQTNLKMAKKERLITHGRMFFVITNLLAEVLLAMSSKGHGDGVLSDETVKKSAMNIAAENIALQNKEDQPGMIKEMATHLASPKIMGGSAYIIEKGLQQKVDELSKNPWSDSYESAAQSAR